MVALQLMLVTIPLQLAAQANPVYQDRLQTAAIKFLSGEDMDCRYPSQHSWWEHLNEDTVSMLRERNPSAMVQAVKSCLDIPEISSAVLDEPANVLLQFIGTVNDLCVSMNINHPVCKHRQIEVHRNFYTPKPDL
jgi:hypothetical protein